MPTLSEWNQICIFLFGERFSGDAEIIFALSNAEDFIRTSELYNRLKASGSKVSRSKVYETLKRYCKLEVVKKKSLEYPEGFLEWSHGQRRRWRAENGWKGSTPATFHRLDVEAVKNLIKSIVLKEVNKISVESVHAMNENMKTGAHLISYLKSR